MKISRIFFIRAIKIYAPFYVDKKNVENADVSYICDRHPDQHLVARIL